MISKDKTYRTRDGREVRIYATDGAFGGPIHGAIEVDDGWEVETWANDGRWRSEIDDEDSPLDLIEVKPRIKREYWANVYPNTVCLYPDKESASDYAYAERLACVKIVINCEEGEGL